MCAIGQFMCDLDFFFVRRKETHLEFIVVNATISEQAL